MTHGDRRDRLEAVMRVLAEDQVSLQKLIAQLATETRQGFDQVARQFAETDRRMQEMNRQTDERFRRSDERSRELDERVDKLVLAIGELIRQRPTTGS